MLLPRLKRLFVAFAAARRAFVGALRPVQGQGASDDKRLRKLAIKMRRQGKNSVHIARTLWPGSGNRHLSKVRRWLTDAGLLNSAG